MFKQLFIFSSIMSVVAEQSRPTNINLGLGGPFGLTGKVSWAPRQGFNPRSLSHGCRYINFCVSKQELLQRLATGKIFYEVCEI